MSKLDRLGWAVCNWFEIDGYRFGVRSTSSAFGEWVAYALGAYAVDGPEYEDDDPTYSLVAGDDTGTSRQAGKRLDILYVGTWDIVRTLDAGVLARAFLHEIEALGFPSRDDAVYLDASVLTGRGSGSDGRTVLLPAYYLPAICRAGRRVQKALDAVLPGTMTVAVDPATGHLVPVRGELQVPADALDEADRRFGTGREERALADRERTVDAVLLGGPRGEPGLTPISRAAALCDLAGAVRNLRVVGGRAVEALGRLLAGANAFEAGFMGTDHMIATLGAALHEGARPGALRDMP